MRKENGIQIVPKTEQNISLRNYGQSIKVQVLQAFWRLYCGLGFPPLFSPISLSFSFCFPFFWFTKNPHYIVNTLSKLKKLVSAGG